MPGRQRHARVPEAAPEPDDKTFVSVTPSGVPNGPIPEVARPSMDILPVRSKNGRRGAETPDRQLPAPLGAGHWMNAPGRHRDGGSRPGEAPAGPPAVILIGGSGEDEIPSAAIEPTDSAGLAETVPLVVEPPITPVEGVAPTATPPDVPSAFAADVIDTADTVEAIEGATPEWAAAAGETAPEWGTRQDWNSQPNQQQWGAPSWDDQQWDDQQWDEQQWDEQQWAEQHWDEFGDQGRLPLESQDGAQIVDDPYDPVTFVDGSAGFGEPPHDPFDEMIHEASGQEAAGQMDPADFAEPLVAEPFVAEPLVAEPLVAEPVERWVPALAADPIPMPIPEPIALSESVTRPEPVAMQDPIAVPDPIVMPEFADDEFADDGADHVAAVRDAAFQDVDPDDPFQLVDAADPDVPWSELLADPAGPAEQPSVQVHTFGPAGLGAPTAFEPPPPDASTVAAATVPAAAPSEWAESQAVSLTQVTPKSLKVRA